MKTPFAELIAGRIVPILEQGIEKGSVQLDRTDCEGLLFVLRTSIPLEPFIELFGEMMKKTAADWRAENRGTNEDINGSGV
jgi:hypothetical protein